MPWPQHYYLGLVANAAQRLVDGKHEAVSLCEHVNYFRKLQFGAEGERSRPGCQGQLAGTVSVGVGAALLTQRERVPGLAY